MKKCGKCGEVKPVEAFSKMAASKDGLQAHCKACNAAYHSANRDKILDQFRAYRSANRDKFNDRARAYRSANIDKSRALGRARSRHAISTMSDNHIKQLLTKNNPLRAADIPDWLIEAKREQLRLKRELRK